MDGKHGRTTSGVICHHRLWTAHTVKKCQVWIYITALGLHPLSDDVGRGMTSPPLDSTHSRMMSGVACHHRLWEAHTIERRWGWHDINAFGKHLRSKDVGRDMPSPPLDNTHGRKTLGVALHHRPWTARTVGRRRAWYDITAPRQLTQSNDVRRGMPSSPLGSTHGRTTLGVA